MEAYVSLKERVETIKHLLEELEYALSQTDDTELQFKIKNEIDEKVKLWVELSQESIVSISSSLPDSIYFQFRKKCIEHGYSTHYCILLLIQAFIEDRILKKTS